MTTTDPQSEGSDLPEQGATNSMIEQSTAPMPRKGGSPWGCLAAVLLLLGLFLVLRLVDGSSTPDMVDIQAQDADVRARAAAENPYASFRTVINECGLCGTDEPYGGWETEDGRTLVLSDNDTFIALFEDGTSMRGDWSLERGELCLQPAAGGETCFRHEQKIDAMTLDDALYIRQ